jgi:hypothetical protein
LFAGAISTRANVGAKPAERVEDSEGNYDADQQ